MTGSPGPWGQSGPLVEVIRGEVVECVHRGRVVITDPAGEVIASIGELDAPFYARSSLKPLQALAMLECGLDVTGAELSLVCGSHTGQTRHQVGVVDILAGAGLRVADLQNTPDLPGDAEARCEWLLAGRGPEPLAQNCSGQHAGMLRTCVRAGWDHSTYREPDHPLQRAIASVLRSATGDASLVTVDGCGAPLFATPIAGLAGAFGRLAAAHHGLERQVADAMRTHPLMMSGTGRIDAALMSAAPGVLSKGGAEGCWAIGLPDGHGLVLKSDDGSPRGVQVAAINLLAQLGVDAPEVAVLGEVPVLGHGSPVGAVNPSDLVAGLLG